MKRRKLLQHLERHGCALIREGGRHTIYGNTLKNLRTSVPRHPEIDAALVRKICRDVAIPYPSEK
jgi:mRNA interferase HicA